MDIIPIPAPAAEGEFMLLLVIPFHGTDLKLVMREWHAGQSPGNETPWGAIPNPHDPRREFSACLINQSDGSIYRADLRALPSSAPPALKLAPG